MQLIKNFKYRPEIDGLRAIAVIAVVLYHSGFGVTGGFVGVDVFFVISGFLITSLIWKDLENGKFTFKSFWERRARRILPAFMVLTVSVLIAGWFLMFPRDLAVTGKATIAQAMFAANIFYWKNTGYFEGAAEEKPLLHMWSLAVEEQFYFIVPLLLVGIFSMVATRGRKPLLIILGIGFACSLALSIVGVQTNPSATFYLLPTRAWELLMGALIAFLPKPNEKNTNVALMELVGFLGLLLIAIPCFSYSTKTLFPGLAAMPPTLGTAAIIWSSRLNTQGKLTKVGAILSTRPIVFLGLISYSWYLWHWPILAFVRYISLDPPSAQVRLLCLFAGFGLAIASWRFIERPFRAKSPQTSQKRVFIYSFTSLAILFVTGTIYFLGSGLPFRISSFQVAAMNAEQDRTVARHTVDDVRAGRLRALGDSSTLNRPSLLVWGDSHAMSALPAVDALLRKHGLSGRAATASSTAPVVGWYYNSRYGLNDNAPEFNEAVVSYVLSNHIEAVLLHGYWRFYAKGPDTLGKSFGEALYNTAEKLRNADIKVYLLLDIPIHSRPIPRLLASPTSAYSGDMNKISLKIPQREDNKFDAIDPQVIDRLRKIGVAIIDPKPAFWDEDEAAYTVYQDGMVLYRDSQHLTATGAKHMLEGFLEKHLEGLIRSK